MTPYEQHNQGEVLRRARQAADSLLGRPDVAPHRQRLAIVLWDSGGPEYAGARSTVDLLVLDAEEPPAVPPQAADGPARYRYAVWTLSELRRRLQDWDDEALFLVRHGVVLYDAGRCATPLWDAPPAVPEEVWSRKIAARYREFRRRQASLAWNLRRGQAFGALDSLTELLGHALVLCLYLEGQVPPPRRWLHRAALRTAMGEQLRPLFFALFSSLGQLATLGGSWDLDQTSFYGPISRIQSQLAEAVDRRTRRRKGA
jgi:hypothetical protein